MKANNPKYFLSAPVTNNYDFGNGWFILECKAPEIAAAAKPGQFVQVRGWDGDALLLGRPFGIAGRKDGGILTLLIKIAGAGTALLSKKQKGDLLHVTGPLGNGFPEIQENENVWLVAGGTGLAPFLLLIQQHHGRHPTLFFGAKTKNDCDHVLRMVYDCGIAPHEAVITTEDGSLGQKGFITDALKNHLSRCGDDSLSGARPCAPTEGMNNPGRAPGKIFTCGPAPMMKKVSELASAANISCFVSLESYMGCGFGACMGCVTPGRDKEYYHVCKDGPVFASDKIKW